MTASTAALVAAIIQRARELYCGDGDAVDRRDAADLACALAKLLAGETLREAFGSPGDWGYESLIGAALYQVYLDGGAE